MLNILVVDDEADFRTALSECLSSAGHEVTFKGDVVAAIEELGRQAFDLVLTDVRMPGSDGFELLRWVKGHRSNTDVVLMTAYGTISGAVTAIQERAVDYLRKPFDPNELLRLLETIEERRRLKAELRQARAELANGKVEKVLIGASPAMVQLRHQIQSVAQSQSTVLITGESGTGKEIVAELIQANSGRGARPFVILNCGAIPPTLIEAELFGHEKGAFTGADQRRDGRFKIADGGTLFLDEIGELPLEAQPRLLRILEQGTFWPVGAKSPVTVDVRFIAATNRSLPALVAEGRFREDLLYRLRVLEVTIPPLRERAGDLPLLVSHVLARLLPPGERTPSIAPSAWSALSHYPFPGNVRELAYAVEHAVVMSRGEREIRLEHLPATIRGGTRAMGPQGRRDDEVSMRPLREAVEALEKDYLTRALSLAKGEKTKASRLLGISRKSLWQKMRRFEIEDRPDASDPVAGPAPAARQRTPGAAAPPAPRMTSSASGR